MLGEIYRFNIEDKSRTTKTTKDQGETERRKDQREEKTNVVHIFTATHNQMGVGL